MKIYGARFAQVPEFVLYADVSPTARLLWAVYSRHADPMGGSFPSNGRLSELLKVDPRTIRRAKRELIDAKLIKAETQLDKHGRQTTDKVWLAAVKPRLRGDKTVPPRGDKNVPLY